MYDFLCVVPHANASHSLVHYLSQHPDIFVSTYTSIWRSLDDIMAHERHFRPFVSKVGISTKDYHDPQIAKQISDAVTKKLAILTVRDPVGSVVAQRNNYLFLAAYNKALGRDFANETVEQHIHDAVLRYVTPTAAEDAYQLNSYERYIIMDVDELKGGKAGEAVARLWRAMGVDVPDEVLAAAKFPSIGSRHYAQLRSFPPVTYTDSSLSVQFLARPEDELWLGYYDAKKNLYSGRETIVYSFKAKDIMPNVPFNVPVCMSAYTAQWAHIHPKLRTGIVHKMLPEFARYMHTFNNAYAVGERNITFTLESFTPLQRDILAAGIEHDFKTFLKRHPEVAEKWVVTRAFLGL